MAVKSGIVVVLRLILSAKFPASGNSQGKPCGFVKNQERQAPETELGCWWGIVVVTAKSSILRLAGTLALRLART